MEKDLQFINEVIIGSSDSRTSKLLARLKREKLVVRLAPRLYTTNLTDSPETIVKRNLWSIVGKLWPGARLSYRTAFEYAPHDGHVFLGYSYTRKAVLPGVTIHFISTPESLPSDYPFMEGLGVSSYARALLENLEPDRTQGGVEKCLSAEMIEERLEAEFATGGEVALNKLRDEARVIAGITGSEYGFSRLDKMVGALLSTRPADDECRADGGRTVEDHRTDGLSSRLHRCVAVSVSRRQARSAGLGHATSLGLQSMAVNRRLRNAEGTS